MFAEGWRWAVVCAGVGLAVAASGQTAEPGNFLNLSVSGDGKTPSALELLAGVERKLSEPQSAVSGSAVGDASWSLPLPLPSARHMPSVSLGYSSAGGVGSVGRGFAVDAGVQIHAPRGREASAYADVPGALVVSGALDGLLVPDGAGWRWVSEQPGALVATHPTPTTWTLSAGGVTWELSARPDVNWATLGEGGEPWRWRTVASHDTRGNRVDYAWSGPDLVSVSWGGTGASGAGTEPHFLKLVFAYGAAAHALRSVDDGIVDLVDARLRSIEVQTSWGHAGFERRLRYELVYDADDELLVRVDERSYGADGASTPARQLAAFEYTEPVDQAELVLDGPAQLGRSRSFSGSDGTSNSRTQAMLADLSGDGLVDLLDTRVSWRVGRQRVDWLAGGLRSPWWEDTTAETPVFSLSGPGADIDADATAVLWADALDEVESTGSYGTRRALDLDGDGYLDVVEATEVPLDYDSGANPEAETHNREPVASTWRVWYGSPTGYEPAGTGSGYAETAPFRFLSVGHRPKLPVAPVGGHPPFYPQQDSLVDLQDIDSDGWVDVVEWVVGDGLYWYRRNPERTAGWQLAGQLALEVTTALALRESTAWVTPAADEPLYEYTPEHLQQTPVFEFIDQRTGLVDVNGDGALDFVDTRSWRETLPEWDVWLGTGRGFDPTPTSWPASVPWLARSDEGTPNVEICSADLEEVEEPIEDPPEVEPSTLRVEGGRACPLSFGRAQAVLGGLFDLDGDGRADLVVGETELWHRNQGDGFDAVGTPLPAWFPRVQVGAFSSPHTSAVLGLSTTTQTVMIASPPTTFPPADGFSTSASVTTRWVGVQDVDGDGLLDVVDRREGPAVWYGGREVGASTGTRPGLLAAVTLGTGAQTSVAYAPSTAMAPAGTDAVHGTPVRKDVVVRIEVTDPVTGLAERTDTVYADGRVEHGRWLGFATVTRDQWSFTAEAGTTDPALRGWRWLGSSQTHQLLSRDAVLPTERIVTTDRAAAYAGPAGEAAVPQERARTAWTYEDHGLPTGPEALWPKTVTTTDWSSDRDNVLATPTSRTSTVSLTYDAVGNLVHQAHTSLARPEDKLELVTTWVADATGALWLPKSIETLSVKRTDVTKLEAVEHVEFGYDGGTVGAAPTDGLLTLQVVCGGLPGPALCDPAQQLVWTFERDARGAVSAVHAPGGRDQFIDAHTFGNLVPSDEQNALGHQTTRIVDDLGRVTEETDPNGVTERTTYDGYGRVVRVERRGSGSALWLLSSETVWHDESTPRWQETRHASWSTLGALRGLWLERQLLDGLGRPLQTWKQNALGTGFVVVDTEADLRGTRTSTSLPRTLTTFGTDYAATRAGPTGAWTVSDVLGTEVLAWDAMTGLLETDAPSPGVVRTLDGAGFGRLLRHDTRGRLVTVEQGRSLTGGEPSAWTITARYTWDGRDRLTSFVDGMNDAVFTDYDGAGRRRQVWRRGHADTADLPWMAFVWDGPDPIEMYEGALAAGDLATSTTYDALGRPLTRAVWDEVSASWLNYGWTWDTGWLGARTSVTDPAGSTEYTYAPDAATGAFGWPTSVKRTWTSGNKVATFSTTYDGDGREVRKVWPSGATMLTGYRPTGQPTTRALSWSTKSANATHLYDALDRPLGWTLTSQGKTWTHGLGYDGSTLRVLSAGWTEAPSGNAHTIAYGVLGNGWPDWKKFDSLEPFSYTYDDLGRVSGYFDGAGIPFETYTYDDANGLLSMSREGEGNWTYAPAPRFGETTGRVGPLTEHMTYDPVTGRLRSWSSDTTGTANDVGRWFDYDGAGRLRRAEHDGPPGDEIASMLYDADDGLVYESRVRPSGTSRTWRFGGLRIDEGGKSFESVLPMARLENGNLRIVYTEADGHAVWTRGSVAALPATEDLAGVYGLELLRFASAPDFELDGFHGAEPDNAQQVAQFGVRHMALRDGAWLQPEPLLYLGLTNGDLEHPLGYSGRYAAGNPNMFADRTGYLNMDDWDWGTPSQHSEGVWKAAAVTAGAGVLPVAGAAVAAAAMAPEATAALLTNAPQLNQAGLLVAEMTAPTGSEVTAIGAGLGAAADAVNDFHLPGDVPNGFVVVKGGTKPPPPAGTVFSGSFGATKADAAAGVPHGQIQPTTAGQIRAEGGTVNVAPELTGDVMNYQHVNVKEGGSPTVFGPPEPNPVPKSDRIGGPGYGQ